MSFLFINSDELTALAGLPYVQQSAYVLGIRPYMDRKTYLVGQKRKISYQSLAEVLYVEPHPGLTHSGSPSRQQLRRIINALERAGLIEIQSVEKQLILKCLLANSDYSVQNKPDTKPTQKTNTNQHVKNNIKSLTYDKREEELNTTLTTKPDIPHNSKDLFFCFQEQFAQFWSLYPLKHDEHKTRLEFTKLNPNAPLLTQMLTALKAQIKNREELEQLGNWLPSWKYPSNWLAQHSWNDELLTLKEKVPHHATHQKSIRKKSAADILTAVCKDAQFDFDINDEERSYSQASNVITIKQQ